MRHIQTVLLATDFSDASLAARDYAVQLQKRMHVEIVVAHVFDRTAFKVPVASHLLPLVDNWLVKHFGELKEKARFKLETFSESLENPDLILLEGNPGKALLDYVLERDVDLVIMGTHGRSGLNHYVMGRVSERVIKKSGCPVLLIKPEGTKRRGLDLKWLSRDRRMASTQPFPESGKEPVQKFGLG
ncbi:universal stress protein [Acanthopleuribacter pedis]|uniref:Universal stress protein n=1 Tax=Acanthopleuribacter pedis TaxID=442870 RepID=A0A8J7QBJ2_9BACT|nr:universal stress protein [Acanthopleuribacter pedis]MBO1317906.1 universal stress protein [Acanthopleuribacter pedis]